MRSGYISLLIGSNLSGNIYYICNVSRCKLLSSDRLTTASIGGILVGKLLSSMAVALLVSDNRS